MRGELDKEREERNYFQVSLTLPLTLPLTLTLIPHPSSLIPHP